MPEIKYDLPYLTDKYGHKYPCTGVMKDIEFQPATGDVFFTIKIINVDRCSKRNLYLFMNIEEMERKFDELWKDFKNQMEEILKVKKKWI